MRPKGAWDTCPATTQWQLHGRRQRHQGYDAGPRSGVAENCADEQMVVRRLAVQEAKRTICELIENWVPWRDAGDWERFDCIGRFYDFFEQREGRWGIVRRQPIYEKDRMIAVRPGETVKLDADMLARFPVGCRHLGYLQARSGFDVKLGLPGLVGDAVDRLYEEGRAWLGGSERPGVPL